MIRYFVFSVIFTLISVFLILYAPLDKTIHQSSDGSPYITEINLLLEKGKTGFSPTEGDRLIMLTKQHNLWLEKSSKINNQNISALGLDGWDQKSLLVTPIILMIWGYFFYRQVSVHFSYNALIVLSIPAVSTVVNILPTLLFVLITLTSTIIWLWVWKSKKT